MVLLLFVGEKKNYTYERIIYKLRRTKTKNIFKYIFRKHINILYLKLTFICQFGDMLICS